jgi:outer membrane protein
VNDRALYGCILVMLTMSSNALGQGLLGTYEQARRNDPVFLSASHVLQSARERVPQALAAVRPSVTFNGGRGQQSGRAAFAVAPPEERGVRNWTWAVQLTQPLWRPVAWSTLDQARWQEQLAEQQYLQAEQELILRVAQAYLDILVASQSRDATQSQQDAIAGQLDLVTRNFQVGMATITDIHEAQSRLDLVRAQVVSTRNDLAVRKAELERIIGEPTEPRTELGENDERAVELMGPEQSWVDSARSDALQVRIAQAALEIAEIEVDRGRAGHSPTLDATASYGSNFSSGSIGSPADISSRTRSAQVGLNFTMPLYAGGGSSARVREAMAQQEKVRDELEAARRDAGFRARQAYAAVQNGQAQIEALRSAVRSSRSALDANRVGYRIGTRINIDVLNAEQQLHAARRDLYKARAETLVQALRLKASNATLSEVDLRHIDRQLLIQ